MASVDLDINIGIQDAVKASKELTKALEKALGGVEKDVKDVGKAIDKSFGGSFKGIRNTAKKALGSINKGFGSLADKIFSVKGAIAGVAGVLAFRELANGLKTVTDAAAVQEDAINQLNIALKSSGQFTEATSQDFQKFASELQKTTKFGDEVLLQNAALIQSLGQLDSAGLKQATAAAADLSAALGIDLSSAATLVGKAAAGNIDTFGRYGVQIKKGATDSETFANAITAINKQFGGAAAGQVNTFSGAVQQLSNTYGDLQETIGFAITQNPAVVSAIKTLNALFTEFGSVLNDNKDQGSDLISSFIEGILNTIPKAINGVADLVDAFGLISLGISPAVRGFDIFFEKLGQGLATLVASVLTVGSAILTGLLSPLKLVAEGLAAIGAISDETAAKLSGPFDAALNATKENFAITKAGAEDLFTTLGEDTTTNTFTSITESSIDAANNIRKLGKTAENVIEKTFDKNAKIKADVEVNTKSIQDEAKKIEFTLEDALKIGDLQLELSKIGKTTEEIAKIDLDKKIRDQVLEVQKFIDEGKISAVQGQDFINQIVKSGADQRAAIESQGNQARLESLKQFALSAGQALQSAISATSGAVLGGVSGAASPVETETKLQDEIKAINQALLAGELTRAQAAEKRFESERIAQEELSKINEQNLQNAGDAVGGLASGIADLVPGFGGIVGGLLDVLSLPPDALASQLTGFVQAIPQFIARIIENIPTLIKALVEGLIDNVIGAIPQLISSLADVVPQLIIGLVDAITDPNFIDALIGAIAKFITAIINALPRIVTAIVNAIPVIIRAIARELPGIIVALLKAIPQIINSIILAIPEIIIALVEAIPIIITGLIEALPELIPEIVNGAIQALPKIIVAFITLIPRIIVTLAKGILGIFQNIGPAIQGIFTNLFSNAGGGFSSKISEAGEAFKSALSKMGENFRRLFIDLPKKFLDGLLNGLTDGIKKVFDKINPFGGGGGGGGIGGAVKKVTSAFGFAEGIGEIPPGFPNDTLSARLSSGERVVPSDTNDQLQRFLNREESGGGRVESLLAEIATMLEQPMQVQTTAKVNNKAFADIILELSRNNSRLTA